MLGGASISRRQLGMNTVARFAARFERDARDELRRCAVRSEQEMRRIIRGDVFTWFILIGAMAMAGEGSSAAGFSAEAEYGAPHYGRVHHCRVRWSLSDLYQADIGRRCIASPIERFSNIATDDDYRFYSVMSLSSLMAMMPSTVEDTLMSAILYHAIISQVRSPPFGFLCEHRSIWSRGSVEGLI